MHGLVHFPHFRINVVSLSSLVFIFLNVVVFINSPCVSIRLRIHSDLQRLEMRFPAFLLLGTKMRGSGTFAVSLPLCS